VWLKETMEESMEYLRTYLRTDAPPEEGEDLIGVTRWREAEVVVEEKLRDVYRFTW